jgi:hypothetical protein
VGIGSSRPGGTSWVLSGTKLAQLVRRLLRQTGRSQEECWRFVIKYFIKAEADHIIDLTIDFLHAALLKR